MANPGDFAYTVKQQADIVRIIGDYVKLKKAGAQNFSGLCPFHGEKTASFSVHATHQFYHCFGCGVSGDVFSFIQKIENVSFPEAVRMVAQKLGIALPKATYSTPQEAHEAKLRGQLLDTQERAAAFFQECLRRPEGAHAREYLKGRGLNEKMIAEFRIGYAPDSGFLLRDRLAKEFSEEALRESGLFSWKQEDGRASGSGPKPESAEPDEDSPKPESRSPKPASAIYSKFRNRVMFPIRNDSGKVIAFTGRTLATDEKAGPKYLNSPETPIYSKSKVLFNLDKAKEAIRKLDYAILVEGQMDCISVYAAGFHNVIAISGTAFTELHGKLLGRFSKNIVVSFDPDTAGTGAADRTGSLLGISKGNVTSGLGESAVENTLGRFAEDGFNARVAKLDPGFDPDLLIRRKGRDAYVEALRGSQKYFDYLIDRARSQFQVGSPEGKVKAVNYLLPHIERVPNRIVRDELAQEIAQKLAIDSGVLRQELRHVAAQRSASTVKASAEAHITDAEKILIRALASARQMQPGEEYLPDADDEFDPASRAHYAFQSEGLHRGMATESLVEALLNAPAEVADVMQIECSESERRILASILLKSDEVLTAEMLDNAVRTLKRIRLTRQREQLQRELNKLNVAANGERMKELLLEVKNLDKALRDASSVRDAGLGENGPNAA